MRAFLLAVSCLIFFATGAEAAAAKPAQAKPVPAKPVKKAAPPQPAVQVAQDLVYATPASAHPLTLDLYQPPRARKDYPKPLLIFVHGGNWNSGDARHGGGFDDFPAILTSVASHGYAVASINYRFSNEAHFPAAVQDAKSAVRWLRAHAVDYNIDTTRVAIWGEEAGGQIAALVGTGCGVSTLEPPSDSKGAVDNATPSDCVQAVIDWHGISDLAGMAQDDAGKPLPGPTPEGAYLGCEPSQCEPGVTRTASPIAYIGPNTPPFLIQHGSRKTVPLAQSQKLADALKAAHLPVEYITYADGEADVAKKAMDQIAQFLAKNFPPARLDKKPLPVTSKALPY